jgi:pimeloyl-ACP methyl ester carboxylesterase
MIPVYFISGLGADASVFGRLKLDPSIEINHIPWLEPKEEEEGIDEYAMRMAESIEDPENSMLVGLSFGGVMAIEIAKRTSIKHVVLISSIKHKEEMPLQLNVIGLFKLNKLVPASNLLHFKPLVNWFFGIRKPDERTMFSELIEQTDEDLVDWSSQQILAWHGEHSLQNITHIHGTADSVFPLRNVRADHIIQGGPHFMVFTHAKEVSAVLNKVILSKA